MIINATNLAMLRQAYNGAFKSSFQSFGAQADWLKIATLVPSSTAENKYAWLGHFPKLREWLGDRIVKNLKQHDYAVRNKKYEATVEVPVDDIEDDQYGVYTPLFSDMGMSAAAWPDDIVFALLAAGASTLCYDGQNFFDTDHPVGSSTASNYDATGGGNLWILMDTRRPLKPVFFQRRMVPQLTMRTKVDDPHVFDNDAYLFGIKARGNAGFGFWQQAYGSLNTLNATNFDAAVASMMALESDEGHKLGIKPNLLVVGPSRRAAALELIEVQRLASGADNKNFKAVDVLVTPHLT